MKTIIGTSIFFVGITVYNAYLRFGSIALGVSAIIGFIILCIVMFIYALRN